MFTSTSHTHHLTLTAHREKHGPFYKITGRYQTQCRQGDVGGGSGGSRGVVAVDRRNSCPSEDF